MKISVIVTAYNHEKYIAQCLESVVKQKGDFQLEVIVGDDCSADNTLNIIKDFQRRYPENFYVFPPEKNLGITKNLKRCLEACSGGYIAICEGDDYWTDENKLQKQKEFLEIRKDCSMCFSAIMLHYVEKDIFVHHHAQSLLQTDAITLEDLIGNNSIGNFSCCMYRSEVVNKLPQRIYDLNTVDWMFNMACAEFGKIGFIKDMMSVYRIHSDGAWSGKDIFEQLNDICDYIDVSNKFFDYKYDALFNQRKNIIKDEIIHTKALEESRKNETKSSIKWINLWMVNIFKAVLRRFKRVLQRSE